MIETAVFGGGCFWCTEAIFAQLRGVVSVTSGYAGGTTANPTYESIANHAEVIKIEFDPTVISYQDLLEVFFAAHDPTTMGRQGSDMGTQYRSLVLYTTSEQKKLAEAAVRPPMVTQIQPLDNFYSAEDYHQNYYEQNQSKPYCQIVISPKLAKIRAKFAGLVKRSNATFPR